MDLNGFREVASHRAAIDQYPILRDERRASCRAQVFAAALGSQSVPEPVRRATHVKPSSIGNMQRQPALVKPIFVAAGLQQRVGNGTGHHPERREGPFRGSAAQWRQVTRKILRFAQNDFLNGSPVAAATRPAAQAVSRRD